MDAAHRNAALVAAWVAIMLDGFSAEPVLDDRGHLVGLQLVIPLPALEGEGLPAVSIEKP